MSLASAEYRNAIPRFSSHELYTIAPNKNLYELKSVFAEDMTLFLREILPNKHSGSNSTC